MKTLKNDERGLGHVVLIVLAVIVIAAVGFAAWRVMGNKKNSSKSTNTSAAAPAAVNKAAEDACKKLYNDGDLCKFASNADISKAAYKATFTTTDKDGKTSTFDTQQDGKGNSSTTTKENGKETGAFVLFNGDSYIKDTAGNSWTKYPKSPSAPAADTTKPTDDLKIDFKDEDSKAPDQRITYKKLGKEKCGNANCLKYQVIDPSQPGTESIVWFGDKDYVLHKWSFKDKDGSTNVGEFTYTAVSISAPSPVKDVPAVPTQAQIQQQIQDAQQSEGNDN